jgi:hypothetical protein
VVFGAAEIEALAKDLDLGKRLEMSELEEDGTNVLSSALGTKDFFT